MGSGASTSRNRASSFRKHSWPATTRRAKKMTKVTVYNDWGKADVRKRGLSLQGGTGGIVFVSNTHTDSMDEVKRQFSSQAFPIKVVFVNLGSKDHMSMRSVCGGAKVNLSNDNAILVSVLNDVVYCVQLLDTAAIDQWSRRYVFPTADKLVCCEYYSNG